MRILKLVCFILLVFAVPAFAATTPPTNVVIDDAAAKQPGVPFDHAAHMKAAKSCTDCHHTEKGLTATSKTDVNACSSCHKEAKGALGTIADASLSKNPFHAQCIGCHKTEKKGPTVCAKCHIKK